MESDFIIPYDTCVRTTLTDHPFSASIITKHMGVSPLCHVGIPIFGRHGASVPRDKREA